MISLNRDEEARQHQFRLLRMEINIVLNMHHDNLASILDLCIYKYRPHRPYYELELTMDLAESDLRVYLQGSHVRINQISYTMKSVLEGLSHIHSNGFIHRDIKPSNILVYRDGGVKITDFGLIRRIDATSWHHASRDERLHVSRNAVGLL